jgi:hypothetical protein
VTPTALHERPDPRPALPQVTLCAIDARSPGLALQAMARSLAQVRFGRALLATHPLPGPGALAAQAAALGVELIDSGPVDSGAAYSHAVLRRLPRWVDTPFALVTQWDGFVVDAGAWRDEFLQWDYLGAPWPEQPPALRVGNGGFSLRSQRLLRAGLDPGLQPEHPEDVALCRTHRARLEREHGLRFAPEALARAFAYENAAPPGPTFGFHGPANLPRVLDEATIAAWLRELPDPFFRSRDARRLARALLARRMPRAAGELLQRRRAAGRDDINTRLLAAGAALLRAWPGTGAGTPEDRR